MTTNNTDGAALLPVTQAARDAACEYLSDIAGLRGKDAVTEIHDDHPTLIAFARFERDILARIATQEDAERSERREGFAPCPTCRQYSHSIDDDALANAFMHFEAMAAHPVRGHPMGHIYDDATRDAAQVLVAAAKGASTPQRQEYDGEAVREALTGLEWTDDGYSLRTPYDGDVDGDGRHVVVGGEVVVTFSDSEVGDEYRERILAALAHPAQARDEMREALDEAFDFLGGCDGASEIRGKILRALSSDKGEER